MIGFENVVGLVGLQFYYYFFCNYIVIYVEFMFIGYISCVYGYFIIVILCIEEEMVVVE